MRFPFLEEFVGVLRRDFCEGINLEKDLDRLLSVLGRDKVGLYLFLAGREWSDDRFSPDITKALVETKDPEWIYLARCGWPDKRFSPDIT